MLRVFVILLVLVNAIALAAWQGWLDGGGSNGEPQRLTNQLKPDHIMVLDEAGVAERQAAYRAAQAPPPPPPAPVVPEPAPAPVVPQPVAVVAPPPPPPPMACVAFEGLNDEGAEALLLDAARSPDLKTRDLTTKVVESWWVHIPRHATRAEAEKRAAEIRAKGWTDLFVIGENGARPLTVSLGLFKSAESAAEQKRRIEAKGVRGVAIEERGDDTHRVEIRGPAEILTERASVWVGQFADATRAECQP